MASKVQMEISDFLQKRSKAAADGTRHPAPGTGGVGRLLATSKLFEFSVFFLLPISFLPGLQVLLMAIIGPVLARVMK